MRLEQELLMQRFPDFTKLLSFGFVRQEDDFVYTASIGEGAFHVRIAISEKGVMDAHVTDAQTDEEYVQIRLAGRRGSYTAGIRQEYLDILEEIARSCYFPIPYLLPQSYRTAEMILQNYGQQPGTGRLRRRECHFFGQDSSRRYALIGPVDLSVYGQEGQGEILEVRCEQDEREAYLQKSGFVRPHYMKQDHWIGILMDESVDDQLISSLLEKSRRIAEGKNAISGLIREWVYPANPKYFDLDHGFSVSDQLYWKQSSKVHVGDLIYIYYGMPFGEIRYLCEVSECDIVNKAPDDGGIRSEILMRIRRLKFFDGHLLNRALLKKYGFTNFRGPRYMSKELKAKICELYEMKEDMQ